MTLTLKTLSRQLAKASKQHPQPLTTEQAVYVVNSLVSILTDELSEPEGRVEIENFLVLENVLYIQSNLTTRTLKVRVSSHLKKRLKARMKP